MTNVLDRDVLTAEAPRAVIIRQLKEWIDSGVLAEGMPLPSERVAAAASSNSSARKAGRKARMKSEPLQNAPAPERWLAAADGLNTVRALADYVTARLNDFKQPNPILRDKRPLLLSWSDGRLRGE